MTPNENRSTKQRPKKERIDRLLVERGLVESRQKAQAVILAGQVKVDGKRVTKAGHRVAQTSQLEIVAAQNPFVSRGGLKLEAALDHFGIGVQGLVALDVGASTGGFTDCLLQRGARKVFAVDVGRGQLHPRLRSDPRVVVLEGFNIRYIKPEDLDEVPDLATIDVSFISLRLVFPVVAKVLGPRGGILALIKPQFEVGRKEVGPKGVVRDETLQRRVVGEISELGRCLGFSPSEAYPSPIKGPRGNQEYFVWFSRV